MINTSARKWVLCSCSASFLYTKFSSHPSILNNCDENNWVGDLGWAPFFILCLDLGLGNSAFYPTILDVKPKYPQITSTWPVLWTVLVDDCLATRSCFFSALVSKVTGALVLEQGDSVGKEWTASKLLTHRSRYMKARRGSCLYFILFRPLSPFWFATSCTFCSMTASSFQHCDSAPTGASGTQSQPIEHPPSSATLRATRSWRVISSNPELKMPTQETAQAHDFTEVEVNVQPHL